MLVLHEDDRGELWKDSVSVRVAAFEPGDKGYEELPLHLCIDEDEDDEYNAGVQQLVLDKEFDHIEHTATSACVTTEHDCFDEQFNGVTSFVKTYMRVQVRAAGDFRHVPVAFFQLEDEFMEHVDLPEASVLARYRHEHAVRARTRHHGHRGSCASPPAASSRPP